MSSLNISPAVGMTPQADGSLFLTSMGMSSRWATGTQYLPPRPLVLEQQQQQKESYLPPKNLLPAVGLDTQELMEGWGQAPAGQLLGSHCKRRHGLGWAQVVAVQRVDSESEQIHLNPDSSGSRSVPGQRALRPASHS